MISRSATGYRRAAPFALGPCRVLSSYAVGNPSALKTILLVAMDPEIGELLAAIPNSKNWRVETAADTGGGLDCVDASAYDLILLDLAASGEAGLDLLHRIRVLRPSAKVIVMTAEAAPASVISSLREQAYGFFSKPYSSSAVEVLIQQALATPAWVDDIEVLSARPNWLTLRMRCKPETADRLVQFMRELKMDLPPAEREDIAMAFREVLMNAIEHGARNNPNKSLRVGYVRTARAVLYFVQDPGQGFRFEDLAHAAISNAPDAPAGHIAIRDEKGIRPGGFGILMARNLVDEMIYNEKGNEVLLIKYLKES